MIADQALRAPRRLLLTLRLGEMPGHLPSMLACRRYGVPMSARIDGGVVDRLLRHHGGAARCARLHNARTPRSARPDVAGGRRYDDIEQLTGVARVLRIEVADDHAVPALVDALAQVARVERVQPDRVCSTPCDAAPRRGLPQRAAGEVDRAAANRPREQLRLPQALSYEPGDPSVIVGLADTGVIPNHGELALRLRRGFDTVDLDAATIGSLTLVGDNRLRDELAQDEVGHGTGCAGIMRAGGVHLPLGALGLCELTPVRVLGAALSGARRVGIGALADIDAGMKRLIDLGVKVINMSFGTPESVLEAGAPLPHEEVIRYALARGVLLVAASGNSGIAERLYPAAHEGVIAVGSVDSDLRPSQFSTRGEHVAVCAPGRDIWTCGLEGYQLATGTSFAAPFVSAICGLMVARAERRAWPLGPDLARSLLMETARPFAAPAHGCGSGVVDALAALQRLDTAIDTALGSNE